MKRIGITGSSGFIGGALAILLKESGHYVIGIDRVKKEHLAKYHDAFYQADFSVLCNSLDYNWLGLDAIVHCAGTSLVGPSINAPLDYYENNVVKSIGLFNWLIKHNPQTHILFSSSASVYRAKKGRLKESDELNPLSPYAKSKLMIENVLQDYARAYYTKATIFRYFNACGSIGDRHGQDPGASHIFPRLFECDGVFELNGTGFKTQDGTCIRDYIHVADIADAHIKAIEYSKTGIYNLGNSIGYSNLEIINTVKKPYRDVGVRVGDADVLIADSSLVKRELGWETSRNLRSIVNDLNRWYRSPTYRNLLENRK